MTVWSACVKIFYMDNKNGNLLFIKGKESFDGKDFSAAVEYFSSAAEGGDTDAMIFLSQCFCGGLGVKKDVDKAFFWLLRAANAGNAEAQYCLALWYSDGVYCVTNYQQSMFWCARAARQGHEEAISYMLELAGDDV